VIRFQGGTALNFRTWPEHYIRVFALLSIGWLAPSGHAGVVNCLANPATIPNDFASPGFGSSATVCGNVTVQNIGGINVAVADAASGAQPASILSQFLNQSAITSFDLVAAVGSAFQFAFTVPTDFVIDYQETSQTLGPNPSFTFYLLDGRVLPLLESLGADRTASLHGRVQIPRGSHTLAWGAAIACALSQPNCAPITSSQGPSVLLSSLTLTEIVITPEPGTAPLIACVLAVVGSFSIRFRDGASYEQSMLDEILTRH
jgi:hypothetical protein